MSTTAATMKREGLEPAMEVIAVGHSEGRDLYDPSPEMDSVMEYLAAQPKSLERDEMIARLAGAILKNDLQIEHGRTIAGFCDELTRLARDAEVSGVSEALSAKAVARHLREPLSRIGDSRRSTVDLIDAFLKVSAATREIPHSQLLSSAVAHELGEPRFALLSRFAEIEGAAGVHPATPKPRQASVEHGSF
jgi:hypothetical protein